MVLEFQPVMAPLYGPFATVRWVFRWCKTPRMHQCQASLRCLHKMAAASKSTAADPRLHWPQYVSRRGMSWLRGGRRILGEDWGRACCWLGKEGVDPSCGSEFYPLPFTWSTSDISWFITTFLSLFSKQMKFLHGKVGVMFPRFFSLSWLTNFNCFPISFLWDL